MPIFTYFALVGSVLVTLLFAADATLPKHGPVVVSSEFYGMPKPWRPENSKTPVLAARAAPEPDMTSEAVRAAAPRPAAHNHMAQADLAKTDMTKTDAAPKKKPVARKQPRPDGDPQNYAWRNGQDGSFGGGPSPFGRF